MAQSDPRIHGWLCRAVNQPEITARLAPLATGAGEAVLDHAAEASHGFLAALVGQAAKACKMDSPASFHHLQPHEALRMGGVWHVVAHCHQPIASAALGRIGLRQHGRRRGPGIAA